MGRKLKKASREKIEQIIIESLESVGIRDVKDSKAALLTRLIISGIGNYFFSKPDNVVNVGFIKLSKSPNKDELFTAEIIRNEEVGIKNAETLWRYYTGEMITETKLKEVVEDFVSELLVYSQEQEQKITKLANKLQ